MARVTVPGVGANLRARIAALVALGVAGLVVARTAGAPGVGAFTLLRVLPWLTGLVMSNGIYAAAPFFLSGPDRDERRFRTTIPAMAVGAGLAGAALWGITTPLFSAALFKGVPTALVAVAGVSILTQLIETTAKACSQGFGDLPGSNRVIVLEELLFLPWYGLLLASGAGTYAAIVFALPLGDLTTAAIAWSRLWRRGYFDGAGRPSLHLAAPVSRFGLRAAVGSIMQTVNARLDFVLVAALIGPKAVGIYAIASRYAELLRLPALALNYVLFPAFARAGTVAARAETTRSLARLWWTPLAAAVPMALLAPYVLPLVYGDEFSGSSGPALVLLAGMSGVVVNGVVTAYLSGIGRPGLGSMAIGCGLAITVVLDLLLIPRVGVMGAAAASTATYLTTTAVLLVAFRRLGVVPARTTSSAIASILPAAP